MLATNLGYAAERFSVDIAKAEAEAAKLLPNPTLDLAADRDLTLRGKREDDGTGSFLPQTMPESRSIGLTQTIELGGKRTWRSRAAEQTYLATAASLQDFLLNLKLDASAAFVDALSARRTLEQKRRGADYLTQLVQAQRLRFEHGDLGEADYLQSRVEELQLQNDLRSAETAATAAQRGLSAFLGGETAGVLIWPRGQLEQPRQTFDLAKLISSALSDRPDLVALRHGRDAALSGVKLARASRIPDVDVGITYTANRASENIIAPSPRFNQVGVSVSIPLPLWNRNQHDIRRARASADQAERQLEAAELKAEISVRTAYANYESAVAKVVQFEGELLRNAEAVLAARRYSYDRGQSSLLELLDAQRTNTDVVESYNDALAEAVKSRIELLRTVGIDDDTL